MRYTFKKPYILNHLYQEGILTPEMRAILDRHENWYEIVLALIKLHEAGMDDSENIALLFSHPNPGFLVQALVDLQKVGILTAEIRAIIAKHLQPSVLARAFIHLHENRVELATPLIKALAADQFPELLARGWAVLALRKKLVLADYEYALTSTQPFFVLHALRILHGNLSNEENSRAVASASKPCFVAQALVMLEEAHLSSDETRAAVASSKDPLYVAALFKLAHAENALTLEARAAMAAAEASMRGSFLCFGMYDVMGAANPHEPVSYRIKVARILLDAVWDHLVENREIHPDVKNLFTEHVFILRGKLSTCELGLLRKVLRPEHVIAEILGVNASRRRPFGSEYEKAKAEFEQREAACLLFLSGVTREQPNDPPIQRSFRRAALFDPHVAREVLEYAGLAPIHRA